jgi:hypothetical protein
MIYFVILISFLIIIVGFSQFIKIESIEEPILNFFVRQLSILTLTISLFAAIVTKGKTIFLLFLMLLIYLFIKKKIIFQLPKQLTKKTLKAILLIIPVIIIQFLLQYDLSKCTPFLPSADILEYASFASSMSQFGNENKYEALSHLYPQLFSGIGPYHYYEIWFSSLLGSITGKSYAFLLQLVVYPYLIWLFILGILSVIENYISRITIKEYCLCFLLLFIGPVYLSIYQSIFNDGDFFSSTVFTVPGFVKQTLAYSYYGQKHLPVYIFGILSFLFLLKRNYTASILIGLTTSVCSFGTFPGVFGAFGLLFLFKKELQTKFNFIIYIMIGLVSVLIMSSFKMGINPEISQKTFYFHDFLKYLNLKGEIIRILTKAVVPFLWLSILYFPFIIIFYFKRKLIFSSNEFKWLYLLISFLFIAGTIFISLVKGLNSDQFLTNLIPLFNVGIIITIIHLYFQLNSKKNVATTIISVSLFANIIFLISYYYEGSIPTNQLYDEKIISNVQQKLKQTKPTDLIAYLLADNTITSKPPSNWYGEKPGKIFCIENYFNLVNINYPYTTYERNSSSIAFCPDNQMRFYLKNKKVPIENFGEIQVDFLKQNKIKWIFCGKGTNLSKEILPLIETIFYDAVSGEKYLKLK